MGDRDVGGAEERADGGINAGDVVGGRGEFLFLIFLFFVFSFFLFLGGFFLGDLFVFFFFSGLVDLCGKERDGSLLPPAHHLGKEKSEEEKNE